MAVVFAFLAAMGTATATTLAAYQGSPLALDSTVNLTCNPATGPGASVALTIKDSGTIGSNSIVVSAGTATGIVITAPSAQTLNSTTNTAGLVYTLAAAAGCAGLSTGTNNLTFHFSSNTNGAGAQQDIAISVVVLVPSSPTSALVATPSTVALSCVYDGSNYYPGPAVTVSVTSAATGGTPFTVATSGGSGQSAWSTASWASVGTASGPSASGTAVTFTVSPASGCGSITTYGNGNSTSIHLVNSPAPDKLIAVTLNILHASPLTATPSPASFTYVKGSGSTGKVSVNITGTGSPAPFFTINSATLPIWLTVDSVSGSVPKSVQFSNTTIADTMAPGSYTATVKIQVSGFGDYSLSVSMLLTNAAPKLSLVEGTTRNLTWTIGQPIPTPVITAMSTDTPIAYTITGTGGALQPTIASGQMSGLAYSFGTPINVSFSTLAFAAAQPGNVLTGTVTLTWGSPVSTVVVTFNVTVQSPGATITGLSPSTIPTSTTTGAQFTVVLTGTGFVVSTDPTQKTKVGIVGTANALTTDTNLNWVVDNPGNIVLTITVPASADAALPFAAGGSVALGVCNPMGSTCSVATGTATLMIGSNPIIQSITSASSLVEVAAPTLPTAAPYDMLSIFGTNFCAPCSTNQVLYATPDPVLQSYPTTVSPDAASSTQRNLYVTFTQHGTPSNVLGTAPLLFATNSQINLLVPSGLASSIGSTVDVLVNFGYGTGSTLKSSAAFPISIVTTNPGVFTVGQDGQGPGAILNSSWQLISASVPAGMRSTQTDSDTVQIYMTGLGAPDSTADNSSAGTSGGAVWPTDCVSTASFLTWFNSQTGNNLLTLDGTLILPSVLNADRFQPCFRPSTTSPSYTSSNMPSVTIGGQPGVVSFAGWVAGDVAGLYQVNVQLPSTRATSANGGNFTTSTGANISHITSPVQLPVVVTTPTVSSLTLSSQAGVTMWVAPRLKVTGPKGSGLTGTVGLAWNSTNDSNNSNTVAATEGNGTYRYAVTSGLLPSGLSLDPVAGTISGTPAPNTGGTYSVTVTASDSETVPLTGTVTFTLTVNGALVMAKTGTSPFSATYGTASASFTTVSATGGVYPYTYAITQPSALPPGLTINSSTGAISTTSYTPAGNYSIVVTATDSTTGTPLTGTINLTLDVALAMAESTPLGSPAGGNSGTITTVSATGYTTGVTYALDTTTAGYSWVSFDMATGVLSVTGSSLTGNYPVTVTATSSAAPTDHSTAGTGSIQFTMVIQ